MTGTDALLKAFDRLFEKAAKKLSVECTEEEKKRPSAALRSVSRCCSMR